MAGGIDDDGGWTIVRGKGKARQGTFLKHGRANATREMGLISSTTFHPLHLLYLLPSSPPLPLHLHLVPARGPDTPNHRQVPASNSPPSSTQIPTQHLNLSHAITQFHGCSLFNHPTSLPTHILARFPACRCHYILRGGASRCRC